MISYIIYILYICKAYILLHTCRRRIDVVKQINSFACTLQDILSPNLFVLDLITFQI